MHRGLTFLVLAIMATISWAAPTPTKHLVKRSFKVPVKGHKKLSPQHAMAHAYRKYGWDISFFDPQQALQSLFPTYGEQQSSAPVIWVFPSSLPWWAAAPSSSAPFASAFPSAISSGSPASASAAPSSVPVWGISSSYSSAPIPSSAPAASSAPAPSQPSSAPQPSASAPSSGNGSEEGEVSALPEQNEAFYLATVSIGGQKLNLNFDTGSADLWVYNSRMPSSETAGHSLYDPSKSSTFTQYQGGSWQIQYGDGSTAEGSVGFDQVEVGGIVAKKQAVELAETVTGNFLQDVQTDGLLGLAFSSLNTVQPQQQKTWFENVMNDLDQPLFTADLEEDASGTYEFGSIDTSKYSGEINYAPVDSSNGFWQFESKTYTVGGTSHTCQTCSPTIADTGTSLVLMDNDVAEAYYKQVNGAQYDSQNGGFLYPCSANLPDFGLAVGDHIVTIKGSDITYAEAGSGYCFGGIQPSGGAGVQIVGDVFLKQYFAIFDAGNMRFGVAAKAG